MEDFGVFEISREETSMSNLGGFHVILKWRLGESIDDGQG
jgi:hypothetical protein